MNGARHPSNSAAGKRARLAPHNVHPGHVADRRSRRWRHLRRWMNRLLGWTKDDWR